MQPADELLAGLGLKEETQYFSQQLFQEGAEGAAEEAALEEAAEAACPAKPSSQPALEDGTLPLLPPGVAASPRGAAGAADAAPAASLGAAAAREESAAAAAQQQGPQQGEVLGKRSPFEEGAGAAGKRPRRGETQRAQQEAEQRQAGEAEKQGHAGAGAAMAEGAAEQPERVLQPLGFVLGVDNEDFQSPVSLASSMLDRCV